MAASRISICLILTAVSLVSLSYSEAKVVRGPPPHEKDRSFKYVRILIERTFTRHWLGKPVFSGGMAICGNDIMKMINTPERLREILLPFERSEFRRILGERPNIGSGQLCNPIYSGGRQNINERIFFYPKIKDCNWLKVELDNKYYNTNIMQYHVNNQTLSEYNVVRRESDNTSYSFGDHLSEGDPFLYETNPFFMETKKQLSRMKIRHIKDHGYKCEIKIAVSDLKDE
jgi:hypothetical protein